MSKTYNYQVKKVAATPRNQRLTDGIQAAAATGGAVYAADSAPQYWELVTVDANGNALEEAGYYLRPVQGKHIVVPGDVTANATEDDINSLPVAADYTTTGLFRAKQGGGLLYDTATNGWYVNPDFAGGGGIDFTVGKGLQMSVDNELSVKYGTVAGTACQGNDSRLSNDRKNPYKLSWDGGEYDGSVDKTLPGFITSVTWAMVSNAVYNNDLRGTPGFYGGDYYLNGNGDLVDLSGYFVTIDTEQTVTGAKKFTSVTHVGPVNNVHILLGQGAGNCINGVNSSGTVANLYFNYVSGSSYTRVDGSNNFVTTGDVVANSTNNPLSSVVPVADNTTYGLVKYDNSTIKKNSSGQLYCTVQGGGSSGVVKYWRPSVNTSGVLSWTLSESESTPSSVNIKGPKGDPGTTGADGQGVTYQWSGTQLRLGTINSNGYVSWGSYVDLKGPKGDPGSGGGSSTFTLKSATFNSEIIWGCPSNSYGIRIRRTGGFTETRISGNIIDGRTGSSYTIGNLYFNYVAGNTNVRIDNQGRIYSNGSQVTSDLRLKTIEGNEEDVLDRMMQIPVIKYKRNDIKGAEQTTGFGAQSFIGVFDNIAFINEDSGYYGIREFAITAIAFQGCKELYTKYKEQQQTIDYLQSKLALLMQEIEKMKGGAV